ncbi:hypothetical protein GCM10018793_12400 [Streptomyces sulfonofaciens]|uniref:Uncharacterized protein n=1 Tax=Streptomyces sulfonofaciens TaxID=68272 RepID=A0A919FXT1_9ACTN|nr:hypothetical protein GCM10018793_12400 [Streptomyces sulfonofaciens]
MRNLLPRLLSRNRFDGRILPIGHRPARLSTFGEAAANWWCASRARGAADRVGSPDGRARITRATHRHVTEQGRSHRTPGDEGPVRWHGQKRRAPARASEPPWSCGTPLTPPPAGHSIPSKRLHGIDSLCIRQLPSRNA